MPYHKYIPGITDKELVVEVIEDIDFKGRVIQRCPRCNSTKNKAILRTQYCIYCGQHIGPKVSEDNKDEIKKSFLDNISLEDLEGV